jgi:type I restriction enzyme S subunit
MAGEWRESTFEELIQARALQIGDGYRAKNSELGGDGPIFLRAGHVRNTHIDLDGVDRFRRNLATAVAPKMSRPGDVIVTTKGNSTGRTSYVGPSSPPFVYSPHLSYWRSLDAHVIVPGFLRYWSRSRHFQDQLTGLAGSTDMAPYLSLVDQKHLRIVIPPAGEQHAIAYVLGALDDKVELNRRMNETLEALARALFKSWFVDFDLVRAKAEGRDPRLPKAIADLFPDSLEDSELGEIPKGWRVGALGHVAEHPRRGAQPSDIAPSTPYIALDHMPKRSIALSEWSIADGVESNKFEFRKSEILFGKLRPYFHKVGVAPVDGVCSTDIVVVRPCSEKWFGFVLGHVSSTSFVDHTNAGSTGTKMPRTSWNDMARYPIVLPTEAIAEAFTEKIRPIVARILASIHQTRTLTALRDTSLPKLLSGELRIKDAEGIASRMGA